MKSSITITSVPKWNLPSMVIDCRGTPLNRTAPLRVVGMASPVPQSGLPEGLNRLYFP
jgi:hypothetical protein